MLSDLSVHDVRVENFVLTAVAVVVTCLRLTDRVRTKRFWWDDAWAAFTVVLLITFMAAVEVHLQDPSRHSGSSKLVIAYMLPHLFYAVTWSARLSILLTIFRISMGVLRKLLVWAGVLFVVTYLVLFAQIWWVCEGNPVWKESFNPQCPLGLNVAIAQVITDTISDAILVLAPLCLVWKTKLSAAQKIRIVSIFSTTLITTAVSLNHAYFVLKWGGLQEAMAAILQCNVCLIVANLSVVIAFFFRISTEEKATVKIFTMQATTRSFLCWGKRSPVPTTPSMIIMTNRRHADPRRPDVAKLNTFAVDTNISGTYIFQEDDTPKFSRTLTGSDEV